MDAIRQWAFSICSAMVACGIALQLMPKSNLSAVFRLVVSVFFLCCLLSPVIIQFPSQRLVIEEYSASLIQEKTQLLNQVVEKQTLDETRRLAGEIIAEKLRQMGINYHSVTININTNGQIDSVDVILPKNLEPLHDNNVKRLKNEFQMNVHLEYE